MSTHTRIQNKRKPRRFWEEHVHRWKASGIQQTEYCRINGLAPKSFTYWKCKLKKEPKGTTFFPITLRTAPVSQNTFKHESLKLICNDRYRIEIGDDFSPKTLTRLIRTIEGL